MTTAIILLGGSSTRMQGSINKAYMNLFNKQVITYSIDAFLKVEDVSQIILVYNRLDLVFILEYWRFLYAQRL